MYNIKREAKHKKYQIVYEIFIIRRINNKNANSDFVTKILRENKTKTSTNVNINLTDTNGKALNIHDEKFKGI